MSFNINDNKTLLQNVESDLSRLNFKVLEIAMYINVLKIIPPLRLILTNGNKFFGYVTKDLLYPTLTVFSNSSLLKLESLADIICADYPQLKNRFVVFYSLLSHYFDSRFELATFTQDLEWLPSVCSIYPNANWPEREIWDMFGIGFLNHPDLRRILTDYGFKGHPLRKEFPVLGFLEVAYSNVLDFIEYKSVTLALLPRHFALSNDVNTSHY